ncbi:hypothetical protein J3R73_000719 [Labrys monachus]|uniref:Uncharacterized protein n=1 Tax=Labrys monachus TaxID=217067 RepID=A0ABU0F8J1_9HYPH|nr:hypothetical protein [Labrys monachus]
MTQLSASFRGSQKCCLGFGRGNMAGRLEAAIVNQSPHRRVARPTAGVDSICANITEIPAFSRFGTPHFLWKCLGSRQGDEGLNVNADSSIVALELHKSRPSSGASRHPQHFRRKCEVPHGRRKIALLSAKLAHMGVDSRFQAIDPLGLVEVVELCHQANHSTDVNKTSTYLDIRPLPWPTLFRNEARRGQGSRYRPVPSTHSGRSRFACGAPAASRRLSVSSWLGNQDGAGAERDRCRPPHCSHGQCRDRRHPVAPGVRSPGRQVCTRGLMRNVPGSGRLRACPRSRARQERRRPLANRPKG